jgi:transcriptional regulator with XRE-family HTH domain
MSKETLLEKLTDQTYREAFISEEIDTGIPMQLRAMREKRGWNQKYIAEKMDTKQPRFSLMEKPGYGNFSLNTLKKLASIFNVGLIVSFVPFSEMIDFVEGFSPKRLEIPSFGDEYAAMERRYSRTLRQFTDDSAQQSLVFPMDASPTVDNSTEALSATSLEAESPYETSAPLAAGQAAGLC